MNAAMHGLLEGVSTAAAVAGAPTCGAARSCSRLCIDRRAGDRAAADALRALTGSDVVPVVLHGCGRPAEAGASAALSMAHVNGRAVAAAAAPGRHIGVDLERAGRAEADEVRFFAHASEAAAAPDPTSLWTLKEAAWKALQCTRDTPFHALRLEMDTAGDVCAVVLRGVRHPARARLWSPWPGWVAAVVEVAPIVAARDVA